MYGRLQTGYIKSCTYSFFIPDVKIKQNVKKQKLKFFVNLPHFGQQYHRLIT